jgi:hypothetical protein
MRRNATAAAMLGREFIFRLTLTSEADGADESADGGSAWHRTDASGRVCGGDDDEANARRPLYRVDAVGLPNLNVMLAQHRTELSAPQLCPGVQ